MAKPIPDYPDGMPRVEPETGRKIVQVVAANDNGWRYMYDDDRDEEEDILFNPPAPATFAEAAAAKAKPAAAPAAPAAQA